MDVDDAFLARLASELARLRLEVATLQTYLAQRTGGENEIFRHVFFQTLITRDVGAAVYKCNLEGEILMDDETHLEITKLKWRVGIWQGILAKLWTHCLSSTTEEPPLEAHRRLLAELEATKEQQGQLLFAASVPEEQRFLLAAVFAETVEEMKAFINSMLAG